MALDAFDRALIAATQGGLPLVARPYEAVGAMLGASGEQVRARLTQMLEHGLQADGIHPTADAQPRLLDNLWPLLEARL